MANVTLMGWNQVVWVDTGSGYNPYKVQDYSVGITQDFNVPQMVSGRSDRMTWSKGMIQAGGTVNVPLLRSTGGLFLTAAEEASVPVDEDGTVNTSAIFSIRSSVHPPIQQSMIQSYTITANEGQPVQLTIEMFGTLLDENGDSSELEAALGSLNFTSSTNKGDTNQSAAIVLGAYGTLGSSTRIGGDPVGTDISLYSSTLEVEEIPNFDQVFGVRENLPTDQNGNPVGEPISFTFSINNNLVRNYVLGSARGLDAFSIASGQREMTGSMSWQSLGAAASTYNGTIGQVVNVGITDPASITKNIYVGGTNDDDTDSIFKINMQEALLLWGATPPQLNTGKVTASANFQLLARDGSGTGPSGTSAKGFIQLQN